MKQIEAFLDALKSNETLRGKFENIEVPSQAYDLIAPYLDGLSIEEFMLELDTAQKGKVEAELSDADLDGVSGGGVMDTLRDWWSDFKKKPKETAQKGLNKAQELLNQGNETLNGPPNPMVEQAKDLYGQAKDLGG